MIAALSLAAALQTLPVATGMSGLWAGPVMNCYSVQCMSGTSWFVVDKTGKYHGHTIAKAPGASCLSYDDKGWTGQLYRLGRYTFYALNDGTDVGYILHVNRDRTFAAGTYMGTEKDVVESNLFFRTTPAEVENTKRVTQPGMCK